MFVQTELQLCRSQPLTEVFIPFSPPLGPSSLFYISEALNSMGPADNTSSLLQVAQKQTVKFQRLDFHLLHR